MYNNINEEYGPHIIIDASVLSNPNYIKNMGLELKTYTLESFVRYIVISNKRYILRSREFPRKSTSLHRFITYQR